MARNARHNTPMIYMTTNVWDAAMQRIGQVFSEFDNVYVSFSGGKDSGVLLHLALHWLEQNQPWRKLGVFHIDYEAQYSATTDYVDEVYARYADRIVNLRCCVPLKCPTCTSMHEAHWRPWDPDKQALWVRQLPEQHLGLESFDFVTPQTSDYEFQEQFSGWWHRRQGAQRTCVLVGIRAQESLDRWRTIVSDRNINKYKKWPWTTKVQPGVFNAYPLYDWATEDIWTANARNAWPYNKLYDLFHYAGVPLHAMRVASPFHSAAKSSLSLYRTIDPDVWGRIVSRVNGVNFTAMYGDTKAMGWRHITKPAHFTWKQYAEFLLETLPEETAANYKEKLATSIKFWRERGGVLSEQAIEDLRKAGINIQVIESSNYKTTKKPVRMEYADEIESKEFSLIPTWKRLVVCILKNDHVGKYMGFSLTKQEMARREAAIAKYKDL